MLTAGLPNQRFLENVLRVMEHIERQMQAELEWVRGLREQELAQKAPLSPDTLSGYFSDA